MFENGRKSIIMLTTNSPLQHCDGIMLNNTMPASFDGNIHDDT